MYETRQATGQQKLTRIYTLKAWSAQQRETKNDKIIEETLRQKCPSCNESQMSPIGDNVQRQTPAAHENARLQARGTIGGPRLVVLSTCTFYLLSLTLLARARASRLLPPFGLSRGRHCPRVQSTTFSCHPASELKIPTHCNQLVVLLVY